MTCLKVFIWACLPTPLMQVSSMKMYGNLRQRRGHPSLYLRSIHNSWNSLPQSETTEETYKKLQNVVQRHLGAIVYEFLVTKHPLVDISLIFEVIMNKCH